MLLPLVRYRPLRPLALLAAALGLGGLAASPAALLGQQVVTLDGAPPPVLPETVARDAQGRATIRAFPLQAPLQLDGVLDEAIFSEIPPVQGMIQVAPDYGTPASEPSDIWVLYDETHMYVV